MYFLGRSLAATHLPPTCRKNRRRSLGLGIKLRLPVPSEAAWSTSSLRLMFFNLIHFRRNRFLRLDLLNSWSSLLAQSDCQ